MTLPQKHFTVVLRSLASVDHTVHSLQTTKVNGEPAPKKIISYQTGAPDDL